MLLDRIIYRAGYAYGWFLAHTVHKKRLMNYVKACMALAPEGLESTKNKTLH